MSKSEVFYMNFAAAKELTRIRKIYTGSEGSCDDTIASILLALAELAWSSTV